MNMKFISKMTNLRLVLRPGIQAQPITGAPAVPTLFLQFKDGMAETDNDEIIEMLLRHNGFNRVFIQVEEGIKPAFEANQKSEPTHVISEIEHGKVKNRSANPVAKTETALQIEQQIQEQAKKLAMQMLPELMKAVAEGASQEQEATDTQPKEEVKGETKTQKSKPKQKNK